jgi:RNA polymerase sigma-70 factor (ECF subfamily)
MAWDRLFFLYRPLVLYWCSRSGIRDDSAEDVVQEVFRELTRSLAAFQANRAGATFRGWLRGITRNCVLTYFRKENRHTPAEGGSLAQLQLAQLPDLGAEEDDAPEQSTGLYRRALELVRGEFQERTWQMFWLVVVEQRSPAQVAAEMGVTSAAVRLAKSRVLGRLREETAGLID